MESRERILLIVLLGLLLFTGFYYINTISTYIPSFEILSQNKTTQPKTDKSDSSQQEKTSQEIKASVLFQKTISRYRQNISEKIFDKRLSLSELNSLKGVSGQFSFEASIKRDTSASRNSLQGKFSGEIIYPDLIDGVFTNFKPDTPSLPETRVTNSEDTSFLKISQMDNFKIARLISLPESPVVLGLTKFKSVVNGSMKKRNWKNNEVFELSVRVDDEPNRAKLFFKREKPRELIGVEFNNEKKWNRRITYSSQGEIKKIVDSLDGSPYRRIEFKGKTRNVFITSQGRSYLSRVRTEIRAKEDGYDFILSGKKNRSDSFVKFASGDLKINGNELESVILNTDFSSFEELMPLSMSLESNKIQWITRELEDDLVAEEEIQQKKILRKLRKLFMDRKTLHDTDAETTESRTKKAHKTDTGDTTQTRLDAENEKSVRMNDSTSAEELSPDKGLSRRKSVGSRYDTIEPPGNSGETIVKNKSDSFPSASPPPKFINAKKAFEAENYIVALRKLQDLADTYPNSSNVNFLSAHIHYRSGHPELAKDYFRKVLDTRHDPQLKSWSRILLKNIVSDTATNE